MRDNLSKTLNLIRPKYIFLIFLVLAMVMIVSALIELNQSKRERKRRAKERPRHELQQARARLRDTLTAEHSKPEGTRGKTSSPAASQPSAQWSSRGAGRHQVRRAARLDVSWILGSSDRHGLTCRSTRFAHGHRWLAD